MSGESTVMPPRKLHDADVVYLYDGSFEGFLCCVFESFAQHEIPFAVWTPQRETATLYPVRDIETDSSRAQRVFSALGRKLGRETEYLVSRDFLSGQEDKELLLIRFLHLAFALGPGTVKRQPVSVMKNLSPSMVIAVDLADIIDPCFHALDLVFKDRFVTAEQIYIPRNDTRSIAPCAGTLARSECGDDLGDHTASQELFLIQIV